MTTYLVWRHGEISPALRALHMEILASQASLAKPELQTHS